MTNEQFNVDEQLLEINMRSTYGDDVVDEAKAAFDELSDEKTAKLGQLEQEMLGKLKVVIAEYDVTTPLAKEVWQLHREWLETMYPEVDDELQRDFAKEMLNNQYFDYYTEQTGSDDALVILHDVIMQWTKENE